MNYSAWLVAGALAFWGWRSHTAWAAGLLLLAVVPVWFGPWRWSLDRAQYHRIGDLTSIVFLGAVVYFVASGQETAPVYALLRWLPALFSPLWLAQVYGAAEALPLGALFYSMRRLQGGEPSPGLDFRMPYVLLCLLAASSGQSPDGGYFVGVMVFLVAILWRNRPRRQPVALWLLLFALAAGLGYGGQWGLTRLQGLVETWIVAWFGGMEGEVDPYQARTAIGDVGRLKLSGRIVMRVATDRPLTGALLLKEAVYDRYLGQSWTAGNAGFLPRVPPRAEGPRHAEVLRIESRRGVVLAVPTGLRGLRLPPPAGGLTANRLGTLQWLDAPPVLRYQVAYDAEAGDAIPPTPEDLALPDSVATMLRPLAQQLGLSALPPERVVAAVAGLFARDFSYSLYLGDRQDGALALKDFLYRRRSGHCEYFATATALLLRAGGVPARYVGGYSVDEYSAGEGLYLVRSRHAHAWVEAYVGGAWRSVDNTPAAWGAQEAETDPWWRAAGDEWSRWTTAFQVWRWERAQSPEAREGFPLWGWLVVPLALWLGWRLYRGRQRVPARRAAGGVAVSVPADVAYRRLEDTLVRAGHPPRGIGEPPLAWLRRIGRTEFEAEVVAYYRRRYR